MRNIHRTGPGSGTAWEVTIGRSSPKRLYRKTFSDSRYADEEASLAAAQAWRDEMEKLHPKQTRKDRLAHPVKSNSSGKTGVYRLVVPSRHPDSNQEPEIYWATMTPNWVTPRRYRKFSIAKYGDGEACRLAVAAREAFEAEAGETTHQTILPAERHRHPPKMRGISRNEKKNAGAWNVSLTRGAPVRVYTKIFSDSRFGGKKPALAAAQAWRDEIEHQHPKLTKKQRAGALSKRNTSGKAGVFRKFHLIQRVDGSEHVVFYWQARTPNGVKPCRTRTFSVEKHGEQEAYRMAVEARLAFEALLGDSV